MAQAWRLLPEVQTTATVTDNAAFVDRAAARKDLIIDVAPSLRLVGHGPQYTVDGQIGLDALYYARDSAPNRILPTGRVALNSAPVPRWLVLDAVASVEQTAENPFAPSPDVQSSVNRLTTSRLLLSPALKHEFSDADSVELRTTQEWSWRSGASEADAVPTHSLTQDHLLRVAHRPLPLGGEVELEQQTTSFGGSTAFESTTARAVFSYAPDPQMIFSAVVGRERSRFSLTENTDTIYGLRAELAPTDRTHILANIEQRFFGTGWDIEASHRSPFVALSLQFVRRATAQTSSIALGIGSSTAGMLDAMLTTRYPDAAARAVVVQDLVARLGLPAALAQPVEVFSEAAQLEQGTSMTASFMGRLTVFTLGLFSREFDQLQRRNDPIPPLAGYDQANRQEGISIDLNRRLAPLTSVDLLLQWSRIRGLGARAGDTNEERELRAALIHQLSARSTVTLGARYRASDASLLGQSTSYETSAFAGLGHRF